MSDRILVGSHVLVISLRDSNQLKEHSEAWKNRQLNALGVVSRIDNNLIYVLHKNVEAVYTSRELQEQLTLPF